MSIGRFLIVGDVICLIGCICFVPWFPIMALPAVLVAFALYMLLNAGGWDS